MTREAPSKKQIDRAGTLLRDWYRGDRDDALDDPDFSDAFDCLAEFREGFAGPLNGVTMGVRSMVNTVGAPVVVSQRLKRVLTIIDKLDRKPTMKVTRMQDIGGCRAIFPLDEHVRGVMERMEKNRWQIRSLDDYATEPKSTGYRAVHVVVMRNDHMIEVQLRTELQHLWASTVERFSGRPGFERIKDGEGPEVAVSFFRLTAEIMTLQGEGVLVDTATMAEFERLRAGLHELSG